MSLNSPICVQLRTDSGSRDITDLVTGGRHSTSAPGGHRSASMSFARPLILAGPELAAYTDVRVTHARHGGVLWEGPLQDPGRGSGSGGPVWDLNALGLGVSHVKDITAPYIGIGGSVDDWVRAFESNSFATINQTETGALGACLEFSVPEGQTITASDDVCAVRYPHFLTTGQNVGTVFTLVRASYADSDQAQTIGVDGSRFDTTDWISSSSTTLQFDAVTDGYGAGVTPFLIWETGVLDHPAAAAEFCRFGEIKVRPIIVDKAGSTIGADTYIKAYVTADEILGDLLGGGRLPLFAGANSVIEVAGSPHQFSHLSYPDGVSTEQILTDLMTMEPGFCWFVWDDGIFYWTAHPTQVRYEIDADVDQFKGSGSTGELYNAVNVRYRSTFGVTQSVRRTSTVPILDNAGLVREFSLDLADNVAVEEYEAVTAGDNFLAEHAYVVRGGSATIARPVYDRIAGRWIDPCEMRAGELAAIRNVDPSHASLMPATPNGSTCFRVVNTDHDWTTNANTVELGQFSRTVERAIKEQGVALAQRRRR